MAYAAEASPYLDRPAIVVAEHEGRIVGATPVVPVPMRAGEHEFTAGYFTDVMVHPNALLAAHGFRPSESPLLSRLTTGGFTAYQYPLDDTPDTLAINPLVPENWRIGVR